ncbi:MAG: hypothetical protein ACI85I_001768 [Arenicella sp.]|jgi:hypothetical protein
MLCVKVRIDRAKNMSSISEIAKNPNSNRSIIIPTTLIAENGSSVFKNSTKEKFCFFGFRKPMLFGKNFN